MNKFQKRAEVKVVFISVSIFPFFVVADEKAMNPITLATFSKIVLISLILNALPKICKQFLQ